MVADKSDVNRATVRACGAVQMIPTKANAANPPKHVAHTLDRGGIEQVVGKCKRCKRIALRCEMTKANFMAVVALTIGSILVQFVQTA